MRYSKNLREILNWIIILVGVGLFATIIYYFASYILSGLQSNG